MSYDVHRVPLQVEQIPLELRALRQWVAWKPKPAETPDKKPGKVPVNPRTGKNAKSSDPTTWGTFEEALACAQQRNLPGVGFVFNKTDDYAGVDLDKCRNPETGELEPWAQEIVRDLNTYTEASVTGTGVHCIGRGVLSGKGRNNGRVEMYDTGRFFCFTGAHVAGTPTTIENRPEEIARLYAKIARVEPEEKERSDAPEAPAEKALPGAGTKAHARAEALVERVLDRCKSAISSAPEGQRNDTLNRNAYTVGGFVGAGLLARLVAESTLREAARAAGLGDSEIEATMRSSLDAGIAKPLTFDGLKDEHRRDRRVVREQLLGEEKRPRIRWIGGHLPEVVDEAERCIAQTRPRILFQQGGRLVRVGGESGSKRIFEVRHAALHELLSREIRWYQESQDDEGPRLIDCPASVASAICARAGVWTDIPEIDGLVRCPILRADGSVLNCPGYDQQTMLFVDIPPETDLQIPTAPTREDSLAALAELKVLVKDFPFVSDADRSVWLAALLTAIVRRSLPSAPAFSFSAPIMSSGKSILVDVISIVVTGEDAVPTTAGKDEEELRKKVTASLIAGIPHIAIDNVKRELDSEVLSVITTQSRWTDRILGVSGMASVATNVLLTITGNNLTITGDLRTRVLQCTLDPKCEAPEEREFDVVPRVYARLHRWRLVRAALVILRAHRVAGRPSVGLRPFGRFEAWSDSVRAPLVWLGEADPCATRKRLAEHDAARARHLALMGAWYACIGNVRRSVTEVIAAAEGSSRSAPTLKESLSAVAATTGGAIDGRRLGTYLASIEGRRVEGFVVERDGSHGHAIRWRVDRFATDLPSSGESPTQTHQPSGAQGVSLVSLGESSISNTKKPTSEPLERAEQHAPTRRTAIRGEETHQLTRLTTLALNVGERVDHDTGEILNGAPPDLPQDVVAQLTWANESGSPQRIAFNERLGQHRARGTREDDALRQAVALEIWRREHGDAPPPAPSAASLEGAPES